MPRRDDLPMNSLDHAYVLLMAGGSGTRFWPLSRRDWPKQMLALAGRDPLLRQTFERTRPLVPPARVLVFTASRLVPAVRRMLPEVPGRNIVGEPIGRNTAPCIGVAAGLARARDPRAVLAVLPTDHVVGPAAAFRSDLSRAVRLAARAPLLVTLGIRPTFPATGYGYIEAGDPLAIDRAFRAVRRFREKPGAAQARRFIATRRFYWNAGIFVWSAGTILDAIRAHHPALGRQLDLLGRSGWRAGAVARAFPSFPSISIDYAVMEKAGNVAVLPARFRWDDVGAWDAIRAHHPGDAMGNVRMGAASAVDARDCLFVAGKGHRVAALGVRDLIVVHTPDATLVCRRGRSQEIRRLVERIRKDGGEPLV
jgi:mannose-1-phosphate guanylyltransferase